MRRRRDDLTGASAVLYARKSTVDVKNPGKSTADQLDTQRARAAHLGLDVVAEFTDDGIGASRHSRGKVRPGFAGAVDYLREHPVEVFALWELSRATRRLRVYGDLMELCEDQGTFLLIGDRIYDPLDSADQTVLGMNAVMDAAEVARLRERVLRGVASTAAAGRPHGRNLYGYERIYDQRTRALLEVREHSEQAPIIRELVRRTLAGHSANAIIRDLNNRLVPKPSGAVWHPTDPRELLSNPAYRGLRSHKGRIIEGTWPALISPDQWQALERIFAGRSRGVHDTSAKHLLTGVAMCARCQRPMYVDIKKGDTTKGYYHCQGCSRSRNAKHLEAHVRAVVNAALAHPGPRQAILNAAQPDRDADLKALAALRSELDDAYRLAEQGEISPRGLASYEKRLVPLITDAERTLVAGPDLPDLTGLVQLPDDDMRARALLRRLVRVWVGQSRRGRGFDPSSIEIRPA